MTRIAISVLIDTFNHQRFIERAIDSVFSQRDVDQSQMEVIVVDDGSTDATPAILERYGARIRVHRKPNGGQATAFNEGMRLCSGDIVALLDGDD